MGVKFLKIFGKLTSLLLDRSFFWRIISDSLRMITKEAAGMATSEASVKCVAVLDRPSTPTVFHVKKKSAH